MRGNVWDFQDGDHVRVVRTSDYYSEEFSIYVNDTGVIGRASSLSSDLLFYPDKDELEAVWGDADPPLILESIGIKCVL